MEEELLTEEESIDGFGIDTDAKREQLNYKPNFTRTPRTRGGVAPEVIVHPEVTTDSDEIELGNGLIATVVESWLDSKEWILELHDDLKRKLRDVFVEVDPDQMESLKAAAEALGVPFNGVVGVELYEAALGALDTIHGELIAKVWEDAAEDLDGNLAMEFFADTKALKDEIPMMDQYLETMLLSKLGLKVEPNRDALEAIEDAELEHGKLVANLSLAEQRAEAGYMNRVLFGSLEEISESKREKHDISYYIGQMKHMRFGMEEAIQVTEGKVGMIDRTLYLIRDNVEQKPYAEVDASVILGNPDAPKAQENKTRMQALLKMSLDAQNGRRDQKKHSLTRVYTPEKRKLVMGELINDVNIFEGVAMPIHHEVGGYDQKLGGVGDVLLNDLMRAVWDSHDTRESRQKEWYGIVMGEAEIRRAKVLDTIEKDSTRQGYHLIADSL